MTEHLTDLDIADYLDDPDQCARAAEFDAHLAECASCREKLEAARRFDTTMDAALISDLVLASRQEKAPPPNLVAQAQRIDSEENAAKRYLASIVMSPEAFARASISQKRELHTPEVVRVLGEAASELREKNPEHALTVANEAVAVAAMLSEERHDNDARAEARAPAQLERANALRYLGKFGEALTALDLAEAEYRSFPLAEWPLALTKYVRSVIFMKSERLEEAAQLASESMRVFRKYGDRRRVIHAQMVIGGCLFYRREYGLARDLYRRLVVEAREIGDPATEARCLLNLAHTESELGQFAASLAHYADAVDRYEKLDRRTEVLRARWGAADLVGLMGDMPGCIRQLRATAAGMLLLGLVNDHALVMLDAVGKLFAIGKLSELPQICADLVRVFVEAKMPENARTALAYLHEAVRSGALTTPLIDGLTEYIEREDYNEQFVPPPA